MTDEPSTSFALITLTAQGQKAWVLLLSAAVCAHPLLTSSCSLKNGDLQKAGRVPEDKCWVSFIWRLALSVPSHLLSYLPFFVRAKLLALKEILKRLQLKIKVRNWTRVDIHGPNDCERLTLPVEEGRRPGCRGSRSAPLSLEEPIKRQISSSLGEL